jgi:DNA-binding transcriptional LysR family regulator
LPFREEDLDAETILQHSAVVVAGAQSPWVRRRKLKLADLADEKWILLPPETPESEWVASAFRLLERGDFLSAEAARSTASGLVCLA